MSYMDPTTTKSWLRTLEFRSLADSCLGFGYQMTATLTSDAEIAGSGSYMDVEQMWFRTRCQMGMGMGIGMV